MEALATPPLPTEPPAAPNVPKAPPPLPLAVGVPIVPEERKPRRLNLAFWTAASASVLLRLRDWLEWNGGGFYGKGYTYTSYGYKTNVVEWLATTFFNPVCFLRFLALWGFFALAFAGGAILWRRYKPFRK